MIENSLIKDLIHRKQKTGRAHIFIIKKDNMKKDKFQLHNFQSNTPVLKIQTRSRSQQRPHSKDKLKTTSNKDPTPKKKQIVRIRQLKTERDSSRRKYKSVQAKTNTISAYEISQPVLKKNNVLRSYLDFIRAQINDQYIVRADFSSIRRKTRTQGQFKAEKNIMEIQINIFEVLYEKISESSKNLEIIQKNCFIYLQSHQKVKLELLISIYYPKLLHLKLRPYLIYQRLIIYCILAMSKGDILEKLGRGIIQSIKLSLKYVKQVLQILMEPIVYKDLGSSINQTFRMLKAVGEMEKKITIIERQLNRMYLWVQVDLQKPLESQWISIIHQNSQERIKYSGPCKGQQSYKCSYLGNISKCLLFLIYLFLQKISSNHTIIYYDRPNKMLKYRPYIDVFLNKLRDVFQLVLYTLSQHDYASIVLSQVQKVGRYFDYMLCESHLIYKQGKWVKDFGRLGRDPRKMLIIDSNNPLDKRFMSNYIQVVQWNGNKQDRVLYKLANLLWELHLSKATDVRQYLRSLNIKLDMIDEQQQQNLIQESA